MTEPTYEYIKGQGWVVTSTQIYQRVIGNWLFTLENRKPREGERWVPWVHGPEHYFDEIVRRNPSRTFTTDDPPLFGFETYFEATGESYVIKVSRAET